MGRVAIHAPHNKAIVRSDGRRRATGVGARTEGATSEEEVMLYWVAALLLLIWMGGQLLDILGGFIHLFLVFATVVVVVGLAKGTRAGRA